MSMLLPATKTLRDKFSDPRPIIYFEVVPPPLKEVEDSENERVFILAHKCSEMFEMMGEEAHKIDAIAIPDIDEVEMGSYGTIILRPPRIPNREFGDAIRGEIQRRNLPLDVILFRRSVSQPVAVHEEWIKGIQQAGYSNVIPVGGDSSSINYPGIKPDEFAELARSFDAQGQRGFDLGSVCIPSRGRVKRQNRPFADDPLLEPQRILGRDMNGTLHHLTQILYETSHLGQFTNNYEALCGEAQRLPNRVSMGVAPILSSKTVDFMENLGVIFPDDVKARILYQNEGISQRSIDHTIDMVKRFRDDYPLGYVRREGFYVCCLNKGSLGPSIELVGRLYEHMSGR